MCFQAAPMIAMMVISAASAGVQAYQSNKARDAAKDAAKEQERLSREAETNQLKALEEQMAQETDKTEIAKLDRKRQALRERAKIRVAASEAGAFGNVILKAESASMVGEGHDLGIMDYNLRATKAQIARRATGVRVGTEAQIARGHAAVPASTPAWMQGLNIGLSGAKGAVSGIAMSGGSSGAGTTSTPYIPAL